MNDSDLSPREILLQKDEVTLVTDDGKLLGRADKLEAHKHPAQLHLAASVWLFNSKKQVLFQKRSDSKIVGAGWWANTVCGNVFPVETYFDCAHRRLKHELNLSEIKVVPVYKFTYRAYCNQQYGEHEIDQVYVGKYEGTVSPNPEEASEVLWIDFATLVEKVRLQNYISPEETLLKTSDSLKELTYPLEFPVIANSKTVTLLLAPWTVMMLKDLRLQEAVDELFKQED